MIISEDDAKKDNNIKKVVDLSNTELELPEIDDMTEYSSIGNEIFLDLTFDEIQQVFDFVEQMKRKNEQI